MLPVQAFLPCFLISLVSTVIDAVYGHLMNAIPQESAMPILQVRQYRAIYTTIHLIGIKSFLVGVLVRIVLNGLLIRGLSRRQLACNPTVKVRGAPHTVFPTPRSPVCQQLFSAHSIKLLPCDLLYLLRIAMIWSRLLQHRGRARSSH